MSQESANYAGSQASRIPTPSIQFTSKAGKSSGSTPRQPCKWTPEISGALVHYFSKLEYPLRHNFDIPFEEPLRSEVRRFLVSLDAYIESPNPAIPYKDILYGSAKLDYATTLKRIKRKSFEKSWKVQHFAIPDWWDEVPWYQITDIGEIFNYSYLIFWLPPEPDDYLQGFADVNIKSSTLSDFKVVLECLLPPRSKFDKIEKMEVLSTVSASMSIDENTMEHIPHYKLKPNNLEFAKKIGMAERVVLNVSPANTRDAVLVNPKALNTISLLDKQIMEILRFMPGHIHIRDKDTVTRKLKDFYKKFPLFLQRDLKKEGITKPRQLLKAMLEVLHETYPDIEIFRNVDFYEDFHLRVGSEIKFPKRGHGQGMANALTTLMQITVHNMILDRLNDMYHEIDSECLALNDDYVVAFQEQQQMEDYWDIEDEVMEELSILRAPDKSFQSDKRFVLAERYFSGSEHKKISYQIRECLLPLTCYNIVHAKEYFKSVQTYVKSEICTHYIDEVINFWGYEFFQDEFRYPALCGGWKNELLNGVDLSLYELDELPFSEKVVRAAHAVRAKPNRKRYNGEIYTAPIIKLFGYPEIPDEFRDHFDILPQSQIDEKYGKVLSRSQKEFCRYWDTLKFNRAKVYSKKREIDFQSFIKWMIHKYDTTIFYPIKHMIKEYAFADSYSGVSRDIYLDPNPRSALIAKYNSIRYPFKEEFSIRFTRADEFTKKHQNLYPKDVERSLRGQILQPLMTGAVDEYLVPRDENTHPERLYLNPIRIGQAASILDWGKGYPIIYEDYKSPILKYKEEVFGRLFTIKEQFLISGYNRTLIKSIARFKNKNPEDSMEKILEYLESVLQDLQCEAQTYESEESDDEGGPRFFKTIDRRVKLDKDKRRIVELEDLIYDESLFWSIVSDPDSYTYTSETEKNIINLLSDVVSLANHADREVFCLENSLVQLVNQYGSLAEFLIKKLSIREIISSSVKNALDDEEVIDYGALWSEDD